MKERSGGRERPGAGAGVDAGGNARGACSGMDEEEAARIDGLRRLGLWISIVYGALCVANVALGEPALVRCVLFAGWAAGWGWAAALLRRNRAGAGAATWPLALGGLFVVAAQQWLSGGISSPEAGGYALVVLVSGLMGGGRLSAWMAGLAAGNAVAMWVAGRHGWVPEALMAEIETRAMLNQLAVVGMSALGVSVSLARIKRSAGVAQSERESAKTVGESFQTLFMKSHAPMALTEEWLRAGEPVRRGLSANEAFCALFKIGSREAVEDHGSQVELWRSKEQLLAVRDELSAKGRVDWMKAGMRTRDGGKRLDCLISAVPVMWEGLGAVLWTFQDVTENEALREELESLNAELEARVEGKARELDRARAELDRRERMAKLGEMVAGVAHEINTPIGNALLAASALGEPSRRLLAMSGGSTLSRAELARAARKVEEGVSIALENLGRASEIIRSFKQLSADQAGETRREFGFDEVVGGALKMAAPAMAARGVGWVLSVSERAKALRVDGYPGALSQIVAAMASNALEHGYGQGGPGRVFEVRIEEASSGGAASSSWMGGRAWRRMSRPRSSSRSSQPRLGRGARGWGWRSRGTWRARRWERPCGWRSTSADAGS